MKILKIEPVTKTKYRIQLEGQLTFLLYKGELSRYHLSEGAEISIQDYQDICRNVLIKRAKMRAMYLLNSMGRTEHQLRQKLMQGEYPPEVVEEAMNYVKSFGYIDDMAYARSFILGRKDRKSRREISRSLREKGISSEIIEAVFEECYEEEDPKAAIEALLRKKNYDADSADRLQKQKMIGYLARKGFCYDDIRQVIQVSEWNA